MKKEWDKGEEKLPGKPYLRDTRVEYKRVSLNHLPRCLDWGKGGRKSGIGDKLEPKAIMEIGRKAERDADSITTEKGGAENPPRAANGPGQWGLSELGRYRERHNYVNFQNRYGPNSWETTPIPPKNRGSFAKGGNQ